MDGAMLEIGPFRSRDDGKTLVENEGSWHKYANLLFLDQPVGTGFSTTDTNSYIHELDEMADDVLKFMDKFFDIFPQYLNTEIYLAGESYAGQYIPYVAKAIVDRNKKIGGQVHNKDKNGEKYFDLKGIMIGNGWIDPIHQYLSYVPFAYSVGLIKEGTPTANEAEEAHKNCARALSDAENITVHLQQCDEIAQILLRRFDGSKSCFNLYDVRLTDSYPSCGMNWPPDLTSVNKYLRNGDVLRALNIPSAGGWIECSGPVQRAFTAKNTPPAIELLPDIINGGVQIMMFNGDQDFICNHIGNEMLISALTWGGKQGFDNTLEIEKEWMFDNESAGTVTTGRNLTYVRAYNSTHMLPWGHPKQSRHMLNVFMGLSNWDDEGLIKNIHDDFNHDLIVDNSNSTSADKAKLIEDATWKAYYRAGTIALIIVIILAVFLTIFVYRSRNLKSKLQLPGNYADRNTSNLFKSFVNGFSRWKSPHPITKQNKTDNGSYINLTTLPSIIVEEDEESALETNSSIATDEENPYDESTPHVTFQDSH